MEFKLAYHIILDTELGLKIVRCIPKSENITTKCRKCSLECFGMRVRTYLQVFLAEWLTLLSLFQLHRRALVPIYILSTFFSFYQLLQMSADSKQEGEKES